MTKAKGKDLSEQLQHIVTNVMRADDPSHPDSVQSLMKVIEDNPRWAKIAQREFDRANPEGQGTEYYEIREKARIVRQYLAFEERLKEHGFTLVGPR